MDAFIRVEDGATCLGRGVTWRSDPWTVPKGVMAMFLAEDRMSGTRLVDGVGFCMTSFRLTPRAAQSQGLSTVNRGSSRQEATSVGHGASVRLFRTRVN